MRSAALFLPLVLATACAKPEPPKITPVSMKVTSVTPLAIGMALELDVENRNSFPLMVRQVSGNMKIGAGVAVGSAQSEPNGTIPAKGTARVPAQLSVGWTNLAALMPLATSNKPVPYTFDGVAKVGSEKLNVDVPFTVKGELTQQQVLQAGLRGLGGLIPVAP